MTQRHVETSDSAIKVNQQIDIEFPQVGPAGLITVAEWTQIWDTVDGLKPGSSYLRVFWSTMLGVSLSGLIVTLGTIFTDVPTAARVSAGLFTAMTALLCVFGFLVDRKVDDSLSVRIVMLKGQLRHLERIRPVLAQRTPHPDD